MIEKTEDGWYRVLDPDGRPVACVEDLDYAQALDKAHGVEAVLCKLPAALGQQLLERSQFAGVTRPAYLLELLRSHLVGESPVFAPRAIGLGAASASTRERVAAAGVNSRIPKRRRKGKRR